MNLQTTLPWFTSNNWFDVIYYAAGTNSLPGSGGGGWGGGGWGGGGWGGGGGGGFGCYSTLSVTGASPSNPSALFLMPGILLTGQTQTGRGSSMSSGNLANYFEDYDNQNIDSSYAQPGVNSNDSLHLLP
jgi:hypothetical protein